MLKKIETATENKKQRDELFSTFEKIAREATGDPTVEVVPKEYGATNGRIIYYPFFDEDFYIAPLRVLYGWLYHEIGHILEEKTHVEQGLLGAIALVKLGVASTPIKKFFLNAFEDVRMERVQSALNPFVAKNLLAANQYFAKRLHARFKSVDLNNFDAPSTKFWHVIGCAIIRQARDEDMTWLPPSCVFCIDAIKEEIDASADAFCAEDCFDLSLLAIKKIFVALDKKGFVLEEAE